MRPRPGRGGRRALPGWKEAAEMGPEELRAFLDEELPRIAEIIARSGARAG